MSEGLTPRSSVVLEEIRKKVEEEKTKYEETIRAQPGDLNVRLDYRKFLAKYGLLQEYYEQSLFIASLLMEDGKYEAAKTELERLVRIFPREEAARRKLIELYSTLGDEEREFFHAQKLATLLILNDKSSEALKVLEELQQKFPDSLDIRFSIARVYRDEGYQDRALNEYLSIAERAEALGDLDIAIRARSEIKYLKPDDVNNLMTLAQLYERKGNYSQAVAEYRDILKYDISNVTAIEGIGRVAFKMKDYGNARSAYRRLVKLDPENPEYNLRYGLVLLNMKSKNNAVEHLEKAGKMYFEMEDWEHAKEAYEALIMIDPKNSEYRAKLNEVILNLEKVKEVEKSAAIAEAEIALGAPQETATESTHQAAEESREAHVEEAQPVQEEPIRRTSRAAFVRKDLDTGRGALGGTGGALLAKQFKPKGGFLKKGLMSRGEGSPDKPLLGDRKPLLARGAKGFLSSGKPLLTKEPLPTSKPTLEEVKNREVEEQVQEVESRIESEKIQETEPLQEVKPADASTDELESRVEKLSESKPQYQEFTLTPMEEEPEAVSVEELSTPTEIELEEAPREPEEVEVTSVSVNEVDESRQLEEEPPSEPEPAVEAPEVHEEFIVTEVDETIAKEIEKTIFIDVFSEDIRMDVADGVFDNPRLEEIPDALLSEYVVAMARVLSREELRRTLKEVVRDYVAERQILRLSQLVNSLAALSWPLDLIVDIQEEVEGAGMEEFASGLRVMIKSKLENFDLSQEELIALWRTNLHTSVSPEYLRRYAEMTINSIIKDSRDELGELEEILLRCLEILPQERRNAIISQLVKKLGLLRGLTRFLTPEILTELSLEELLRAVESLDGSEPEELRRMLFEQLLQSLKGESVDEGVLRRVAAVSTRALKSLQPEQASQLLHELLDKLLLVGMRDEAVELLKENLSLLSAEQLIRLRDLLSELDEPTATLRLMEIADEPLELARLLLNLVRATDDDKLLMRGIEIYVSKSSFGMDLLYLHRFLEEKGWAEDRIESFFSRVDEILSSQVSDTSRTKFIGVVLSIVRGNYEEADARLREIILGYKEALEQAAAYLLLGFSALERYLRGKFSASIFISQNTLRKAMRFLSNVPESPEKKYLNLVAQYQMALLSELRGQLSEAVKLLQGVAEEGFWDASKRLEFLLSREG